MSFEDDINPLDWFNMRLMSYSPPHFCKIKLTNTQIDDLPYLLKWVSDNTTGRFSLINDYSPAEMRLSFQSQMVEKPVISFENPIDVTTFVMFYN